MIPESAPVSDDVVRGAEHTVLEIAQQPALWRQVPGSVEPGLAAFVGDVLTARSARVVLTGAGTRSIGSCRASGSTASTALGD